MARATDTAAKKNEEATAKSGNDIPKSSLTSAVTSDLPNTADTDAPATIDLTKVQVPQSAITQPAAAPAAAGELSEADEAEQAARDKSFQQRAMDYGIGQVQVEGIDFRYIGVAPARDKEAQTEFGYPITPMNSRFTPLAEVPFHPSLRIKNQATGEFYYPADGVTGWGEVESADGEPLVPKDPHPTAGKDRRSDLLAARSR